MSALSISEKRKRMRLKPNKKWTKADVDQLLQWVLISKNAFEQPTAQIFYRRIIENEPTLEQYEWCGLRDKMRNLRKKYKDAIDWRNETSAGQTDEDQEETIKGHILKLCPHFETMDEIFGSKSNIHPLYISESGVPENQEMLTSSESSSLPVETVKIEYINGDNEAVDVHEEDMIASQTENIDESEFNAQQFIKKLSSKPTSGSLKSRSASTYQYNNSVKYLAHVQEARLAHLAEIRSAQLRMDEKKLELETQKAADEVEMKNKQLELERSRLQFEMDKWREQSRLAQIEIEKKFELDRLKTEKEFEIKKYELDLKYKLHSE